MCRAHATVRGLIREIVAGAEGVAIADLEAGLEPLSRGTPRHTDVIVAVLEPYHRSLEAGARVLELAKQLGVARVFGVANKVRDAEDRSAIETLCRTREIALLGMVPFDEAVIEADRRGAALIDVAPGSPAVQAITAFGAALFPANA
jgi:CO dehydrogenase maturation factor